MGRATGGEIGGRERDGGEDDNDGDESRWVRGFHPVDERGHVAREGERGSDTDDDSHEHEPHPLQHDHAANILRAGAESDANADFLCALLDRIGHQAIDADGGERESESGEDGQKSHIEIGGGGGFGVDLIHGFDMADGKTAAGVTEGFLDFGAERKGRDSGANSEFQRRDVGVERGDAVRNLRDGNVHDGRRVAVEATIAGVADDAEDLARGLREFGADAFANGDARADAAVLGPIVLGHPFADEHDAGRAGVVMDGKHAAAKKRDAEDGEVFRRNDLVARATVVRALRVWASFDGEGQAEAPLQRQAAGGGHCFDSGEGFDVTAGLFDEFSNGGGFLEARAADGHVHGEDVMSAEAGINAAQSGEGADEKHGTDEQDQRERHFRDDEERARFVLAQAAAGARATFAEGDAQIGARGSERRNQAKEHAGEKRNQNGEDKDPPVESDVGAVLADEWDVAGIDGEEGADAGVSNEQANGAADEREKNAFGKQLRNYAAAAGAKSGANGNFTPANGGANEEQVGDVCARDEQNEADRAEQYEERKAGVADHCLLHGNRSEASFRVRFRREFFAEFFCGELHRCSGHGYRDAGLEACGGLEVKGLVGAVWVGLERENDVDGKIGMKRWGDDAGDDVRIAIEFDGFADDGWVGAKMAAPQTVRNDRELGPVGAVFLGGEGTAHQHGHSEDGEIASGGAKTVELLGLIAAGKIHTRAAHLIGGDGVEHLSLLTPGAESGNRGVVEVAVGGVLAELNEAARIGIGKRLEKNFVYDGEDGGVGTDAEGEREDGGDGEAGSAEEHAGGVAQVLDEIVNEGDSDQVKTLPSERGPAPRSAYAQRHARTQLFALYSVIVRRASQMLRPQSRPDS